MPKEWEQRCAPAGHRSPMDKKTLDEPYWFVERKPRTEIRENFWAMMMVSGQPRRIAGSDAACGKNDTYTVEGLNADLRHYIPIRARCSRSFTRTLETLQAIARVYVEIYNRLSPRNMTIVCAKLRVASLLLSLIHFNQLRGTLLS